MCVARYVICHVTENICSQVVRSQIGESPAGAGVHPLASDCRSGRVRAARFPGRVRFHATRRRLPLLVGEGGACPHQAGNNSSSAVSNEWSARAAATRSANCSQSSVPRSLEKSNNAPAMTATRRGELSPLR
jgi:hypothetical protein